MDFMVSELEGTLLKNPDPFSYFMLVAFEASGLIRFGLLLMLWPVIRVLEKCGRKDGGLKLSIFVATAGIRVSEIESVARAVLPKFYLDDVDLEAWRVFIRSPEKRVVATKMPRVMVECFVKDHLLADGVIGSELVVNRFGFAIGFVKEDIGSMSGRVAAALFGDGEPSLGVRKPESGSSFLSICKEETHPRFINKNTKEQELLRPLPVIFHDGRLVKRPTPSTALLILLWIPIGIIIALIRMIAGLTLPMQALPIIWLFGGRLIVKGKPPPPASANNSGVLFVCTHRTVFDPIVLSYVLQRRVTAVTYSISRFSEIFSPIPTVHLTRIRHVDAMIIKRELEKGDLFLCPEGTTCREPFLLRFSALFAELTDRIVPVAMNYQVEFFHPTRARGWKGLDPFFYFMNPRPLYEVTFLNQLPHEATCSSGKSPYDVANYVQSLLAAPLGFECTHFTRKDKYRVLAGTDGSVKNSSIADRLMKLVKDFHF